MTRKRIKHKQIQNESKRNSTYGKRAEGFLKKANELSTLCGVDIAVVVHKQGGERNSILWPSPPIFRERMNKFLEFSNRERNRRLVTHDKFMEQTTSSATENLLNFRKKIVSTESHQLMTELTQGKNLKELDWYQLHCLSSLADDVIKKVEKRDNEITEEQLQRGQPLVLLPLPPALPLQPPSVPSELAAVATAEQQEMGGEASALDFGGIGIAGETSEAAAPTQSFLDNLRNDKWFTETMSEEQGLINFFEAPSLPDVGGAVDGVNAPANPSNDFVP